MVAGPESLNAERVTVCRIDEASNPPVYVATSIGRLGRGALDHLAEAR